MNYEANCRMQVLPDGTIVYKAWFDEIPCIVGIGDTIEEAVDRLYEIAERYLDKPKGENNGH